MTTRRIWAGLAVGGASACIAGAWLAGPASAATTECDGTIGAETISGRLVVPPGDICVLAGTTVKGRVSVMQGATLETKYGSTVNISRSVIAIGARSLFLEAMGTIGGPVSATETGEQIILQQGTVDGQVSVIRPGFDGVLMLEETGLGGLRVEGSSDTSSVEVRGSSFAERARIVDNSFDEGAALHGDGLTVKGSTFGTNLVIKGNKGVILRVGSNGVEGSLSIKENLLAEGQYQSEVHENTVADRLVCIGDTPESEFRAFDNTAALKRGQCAEAE